MLRPSRILRLTRRLLRNDQLLLGLFALIVGALAGGAVVLFREAIAVVQGLAYGSGDERLWRVAETLPWWHLLLVPTAGGLAVGLLLAWTNRGERAPGVAQVIESAALKGARMSGQHGLRAAALSAFSIGLGASVGREGPAVHLGATIGAMVAETLRLSRNLSRSLLGCGVAAAVAASFNAPIAGALFAHEVVVGHYALSAFAPIVIASVTATVISRARFGDFPAFSLPEFELASLWEFPAFVGLGVVSGVMAALFMRAIFLAEGRFARLPGPAWLRPAAGGLLLGALAVAFPAVLGVGYELTDEALRGGLALGTLALLVLAKTAATAISLGSGFPGGVFSPSLAVGALLGGTYGGIVTWLLPHLSSGPGAYALVGMGAVAAAVLGAPISTTLIVFELTADYTPTVAVMIAVVVASVVSRQVHRQPSFFHMQLARRGTNLSGGLEARLLKTLAVREVTRPAAQIFMGASLAAVRVALQTTAYGEVFVTDKGGHLYGSITLADLSETAFDPSLDDLVNAADVARPHPPLVALRDDMETALQLMMSCGEEHIAVVDHHDTLRLVGCIHQADVLLAYNRALLAARAEAAGER